VTVPPEAVEIDALALASARARHCPEETYAVDYSVSNCRWVLKEAARALETHTGRLPELTKTSTRDSTTESKNGGR